MFALNDIPVFTTINGVASLILHQIPYTGIAYIRVQSSQSPDSLLKECVDFCVAVGANAVHATGHAYLDGFPVTTKVVLMRCSDPVFPETMAHLIPVQENTVADFRRIYNSVMSKIPNAACFTVSEMRQHFQKGNCYFVFGENQMIGIGIAGGNRLDAIVSVEPGWGSDILSALFGVMDHNEIQVEVASANERAMRFFLKHGFVQGKTISKWYKVF